MLSKKIAQLRWIICFCLLLSLSGCKPKTAEDFRREGVRATRALLKEIEAIHTQDELTAAIPRLRKHYVRLAKLVIQARKLKERGDEPIDPTEVSDELFAEMARLYELPRGKELLLFAQQDSLKLLKSS